MSEKAQADSLCRVLSNYWSFWSRCGTSLFLDRINNTSSALSCVLKSTFSVWGEVLYRLHLHSQVTASAHSVFRSFTLWHPGQSFWKIKCDEKKKNILQMLQYWGFLEPLHIWIPTAFQYGFFICLPSYCNQELWRDASLKAASYLSTP